MSFDEDSIIVTAEGSQVLTILEHGYDFDRQIYTIQYDPGLLGATYTLNIFGQFSGNIIQGIAKKL